MKIKIAKTVATLLLAQAALLADSTQQTDLNVNVSAFDAQINSITSAQLEEEQASDVKDILKSIPSVTVDGNARYGQKVYVRGLEDKFSNITVDGAKLGGQLFHHSGDQTIDASLLKITSVELGPNSALSGSGVINGSFSYETKDPSDFLKEGETFGGKISLGYQSAYERQTGTVAVFGKINDKFEFVGMGTVSKDGTLHLGNDEDVKSKASKLQSGLLKLVFKADDYNTFKLSYNKYKDGGNRQLTGEKVGTEDEDQRYNSITRETYTLNYEYRPQNDLINLKANVYTNEQYLDREGATAADASTKYLNKTSGYDFRNTSLFDLHKVTYGSDYTQEEQEIEGQTNIEGGKIDNKGLYVEDEIVLNDLTLTLGARYDRHELGGIYDGTFTQLSPKMKLKYQATNNLTLKSGYGHIFKGPSLGETLMLNSSITQSEDTKAQTGDNFEIGFDYDLTTALDADNSVFGFNVYRYNVDNYAHTTKNNSLNSQSDMLLWGLESMFSYNKDKFGLKLSHTYTDGEEKNLASGVTFDPKTSKIHVFKFGLNYQVTPELKFNYNGQAVPGNDYTTYSTRNSTLSTNKRAGYSVHDINFTLKPTTLKNTTLNFGIGNIFNKAYVRHTAFGSQTSSTNKSYEVGRNFKFQVAYRF
ncbi:MAG: TonB-dependent receptor [Arcobacteraceae bacterium]